MLESNRDAEQDRDAASDQFARRLEQLDEALAGQADSGDVDDQTNQDADDQTDREIAAAGNVLRLLHQVRQRDADQHNRDRGSCDAETDRGEDAADRTRDQEMIASNHHPSSGGQADRNSAWVNHRVSSYVIEETIARGGMGVVFRARDTRLNRLVALKMMLTGPFSYEQERDRFRVEAEAAARLDHPGIVPVYEVGQHDGQLFFTMGLVTGESLGERIRREPLRPRYAAELAKQIASAVHYAHERGVIHRDIKPANVLLDRSNRARITDFGLARRTDSISDLTGTEQVLGTPNYMAPEQASGKASEAGPMADVYSIGATLYCMLTGNPPFQAASTAETLRMVMDRDPVAPRQANPSIPVDLNTICLRCLQKDPHRRYQSAAALQADLERFLDGRPILARPVGPIERGWKWSCRHPLVAGLSAVVAVALVAILIGGAWYQTRLTSTLNELKTSRQSTIDHLYRSLTSEAQYLNEIRPLGYGPRVESLIDQARQLESTEQDTGQLRQLAVSRLGHVGVREPLDLPPADAAIRAAAVLEASRQLVVGLESGDVVLYDMEEATKLQQIKVMDFPIVRVDADRKNRGEAGKRILAYGEFNRQLAELVLSEQGRLEVDSVRTLDWPEDFVGVQATPDGRYVIGIQPTGQSVRPDHWVTPSTVVPSTNFEKARVQPEQQAEHFAVASLDHPEQTIRKLPISASARFDVSDHYLVVARSWLDGHSGGDEILVYDHHSGRLKSSFNSSVGSLLNVRVSRKGWYIACGGTYGAAIFHLPTGERIAHFDDLGSCVVESFVGDDGDVLVRNGNQSIWLSPRQRSPVARFDHDPGHRGVMLRFSSGGRYAMWTGTRQPRVVDTRSSQRVRIAAHSRITHSVSFSPDARLLITTGEYYGGNLSRVWNAVTGELEFEFRGAESTFSPDGRWIASWDGRLQIWETSTGELACSAPTPGYPNTIRFSDSGNTIVVSGRIPGQLQVFRLGPLPQPSSQSQDSATAKSAAFNSASMKLTPCFSDELGAVPVALSPSGRRVAYRRGRSIRVYDLDQQSMLREIDPGVSPALDSMTFSEEEKLLLIARTLQVWNVADGVCESTAQSACRPPLVLAPDRRHVLCQRKLLRIEDLQPVFEFPAWVQSTKAAAWSGDGRRIALGLDGGDASIWDLALVRATLRDQMLPWQDVPTGDSPPDDRITEMLRLGRRHAGRLAPRQWEERYDLLISRMDGGIERDLMLREVGWLSENLEKIGDRPFFEQTFSDSDWVQVSRLVYDLAGRLGKRKEYQPELALLAAMQRAFEQVDRPNADLIRSVGMIYHTSADVYNFFQPDRQACFDAYAEEERLITRLLDHPKQPQTRESVASALFWLNRNLALALARAGEIESAIARMEAAVKLPQQWPDLGIDPQTIATANRTLADWSAKTSE